MGGESRHVESLISWVVPQAAASKFSKKESSMNGRRDTLDDKQIDAIEGRLAGTLRPVRPPRDFVQRLRGHVHLPERGELAVRLYDWERLLLVISGVLSGAVVILSVARAMYHLFGRRSG